MVVSVNRGNHPYRHQQITFMGPQRSTPDSGEPPFRYLKGLELAGLPRGGTVVTVVHFEQQLLPPYNC